MAPGSSTLGLFGRNSRLSVSEACCSGVALDFGVDAPGVRSTDFGVLTPGVGVAPLGVLVGVGVFEEWCLCDGDGV